MNNLKIDLLVDEIILNTARTHVAVFIVPFFWLILAAFVYQHFTYPIFSFAPLLIALSTGIDRIISFFCSTYTLTNQRLLAKQGLLHRRLIQIPLIKLANVRIKQSWPGKLFNYATVIISGAEGSTESFVCLANPLVFAQKAQEFIAKKQQNYG